MARAKRGKREGASSLDGWESGSRPQHHTHRDSFAVLREGCCTSSDCCCLSAPVGRPSPASGLSALDAALSPPETRLAEATPPRLESCDEAVAEAALSGLLRMSREPDTVLVIDSTAGASAGLIAMAWVMTRSPPELPVSTLKAVFTKIIKFGCIAGNRAGSKSIRVTLEPCTGAIS